MIVHLRKMMQINVNVFSIFHFFDWWKPIQTAKHYCLKLPLPQEMVVFCVCSKSKTLCICQLFLSSSPPLSKILGNLEQNNILKKTKQLIEYVVLGINFRSVKCMTLWDTNISSNTLFPFKSYKRLQWVVANKPVQKAFKNL